MTGSAAVGQFEQRAEASYLAMYEAARHNVKDCHDDAQLHFHEAIEVARQAGLEAEVARLTARADHVRQVYNSQFRGL